MASGVVCNSGMVAMLNALLNGQTFTPNIIQVSSMVSTCTGLETSLPDIVWTAPSTCITQVTLDSNTIRTIVFMDTTVGTFNIGSMGIYTSDGTLFAIGVFPGAGIKIADNLPSVVGNIRCFYLDVNFADASNSIITEVTSVTNNTIQEALSSGALTAGLMLSGIGAPGPDVGTIGDFYVDTTNLLLYGAKTASGWGGGISFGNI